MKKENKDKGIGRIIGNGVKDDESFFSLRVKEKNESIENLKRRSNIVGGVKKIEKREVRKFKRRINGKGDLRIDERMDEEVGRNEREILKRNVIEKKEGIRNVDIKRILNGIGCKEDIKEDKKEERRDFMIKKWGMKRIGVINGNERMIEREKKEMNEGIIR